MNIEIDSWAKSFTELLRRHAAVAAALTITLASAAQAQQWSLGTEEKGKPKPKAAPSTAVIDLCQIPAPTKGGVGFDRQRLVLFDLDGEAVTHGPEREVNDKGEEIKGVEHRAFQSARVHDHLRNVFFGTFPMERFHTVAAQVPAPAAFTNKPSIAHAEMIRAAELDQFAAYSIACADWVMLPRVTDKAATWRRTTQERQVGKQKEKYQAWTLSNKFEIEIDLYQFDGQNWKLVRTVKRDAGLVGLASDLTEIGDGLDQLVSTLGGKKEERDAVGALSAAPELTCRVPLVADLQDIADGYGKCGAATLAVTSSAKEALQLNPKEAPKEAAEKGSNEESSDTTEADEAKTDAKKPTESDTRKPESNKPKGETDAKKPTEETAKEAEGDEEAEEIPEPVLDEVTRETLEMATSGNPRRSIEGLTKQELGEQVPKGMVEAVGAAKVAASTCKAGVDAVIGASQKLRSLATRSPTGTLAQAAAGFAACAGIPLTYDLGNATPPGSEQRRSEHCKNLGERDDVARGIAAMHDVALCVGRVSGEHTTLVVRNDVATTPGIRIEVPLLAVATDQGNRFGLAVGKTEGVKRGDMYVARDATGGLLGFGFVVLRGPGGDEGAESPSHYRFRAGTAPVGTNMEEHPKIGFLLGARPQLGLLLKKDALASSLLIGGAIEGGYNAGQFVDMGDEFWVRTNLAFLVGREEEMFFVLEFVPEAQFYLFDRVAAFWQAGVGATIGSKKVPGLLAEDINLSGWALSVVLGLGLDVAVTPDWNARVAVTGNQGLNALTLKDDTGSFVLDAGRLTMVQGTVALDYSF